MKGAVSGGRVGEFTIMSVVCPCGLFHVSLLSFFVCWFLF